MKSWDEVEILLVEDNPTDAELCKEALADFNLGNRLIWLKDGAEALDYLFCKGEFAARNAAERPHVVLLDLRLPKVDGIEVLRAMKNDDQTRTIPVVVVTSSREESDLVRSYGLGVNSYVQKPVEFEAFAREIARVGYYWLMTNKVPGK